MLTILKEYFFTGVTGNLAYDMLDRFWRQAFGKDLEDVYLDAFEQAVAEARSRLSCYGDLVELNRAALRQALHADLQVDVRRETLSSLDEEDFIQRLAAAMHRRQALTLGGHNLTEPEYRHLLRNLIRQAHAVLRQHVQSNEAAFRQMLLAEVGDNRRQLDDLRRYLAERLDLAAVVQQLDAIQDQTRLTPAIHDALQDQGQLLRQVANDVRSLRRPQAQAAPPAPGGYTIHIQNANGLVIGNGAHVQQTFAGGNAPAGGDSPGGLTMPRQRTEQRQRELQAEWGDLSGRIEALRRDLGVETDGERRHTLRKRLDDLQAERDKVETELREVEQHLESRE